MICSFQGTIRTYTSPSGDGEIRTLDPLLARQVLSQLSYTPILVYYFIILFTTFVVMGLSGLEPPTSRLSGVRSNRLSYKPLYNKPFALLYFLKIRHPPALPYRLQYSTIGRLSLNRRVRDGNGCAPLVASTPEYFLPLKSKIKQYPQPLLSSLERR